jgi:hypothetical protein
MEFLNGILSRDLESSQTQILSGFLPSFFEFSCFAVFFKCIFKTKAESSFVYKSASRKTVNSGAKDSSPLSN